MDRQPAWQQESIKPALDPDMPAQQLCLHLGEMTAQEMRVARAAIRWANSCMQATPSSAEGAWLKSHQSEEQAGDIGEQRIKCHEWNAEPMVKTTPVKCLLCESEAVAVGYFPHGCTCSPNKIQPRCMQHLIRADDTEEEFVILEDFRITERRTENDRGAPL